MAFSNFKTLEDVLSKHPLRIIRESFLPKEELELPELFLENLDFALRRKTNYDNEYYFTENFIYPFLQFAWKRHERLQLWSHKPLNYDEEFCGEPDYFLSYWPDEVISKMINKPLLAVAEAKKQDFERGWAQCLAGLIACQKLNENPDIIVYGIVSTGTVWEFGKLEGNTFTQSPASYSLNSPQLLAGILDFIFTQCEIQALQEPSNL